MLDLKQNHLLTFRYTTNQINRLTANNNTFTIINIIIIISIIIYFIKWLKAAIYWR